MALSLSEAKVSIQIRSGQDPESEWQETRGCWGELAAGKVQESPAKADGVTDGVAHLLVSIAGF